MSRLIRFRDLVKHNNYFEPCPKCGAVAVMQARYNWNYIVADPKCQNCKFRFVEQKSRWLRRRMFRVMSPEEYDQMVRDRINRYEATRATQ